MENTNVLKTAIGVGILGTVAVYLGYSYFNEDGDLIETPTVDATELPLANDSVTNEVAKHLEEKKNAFSTFFQNAYKVLNSEEQNDNRDNSTDYN
jgi:hypothetical protein